jgi:hypothetical protein
MSKFIKYLVLLVLLFPAAALAQTNPNTSVEAQVRASFPDMPDMIPIAQCESGFRQFAADGSPLRGGTGKRYIGIFQIDENLHRQNALNMAIDINTVEGNIAYARHMFFQRGSAPWKGCLSNTPTQQPTPAPAPVLNPIPTPVPLPTPVPTSSVAVGKLLINLNFGMIHPDVLILQKIMNNYGFVIYSSGAGSPGSETNYFGMLTREAVRKFQCSKSIACDGNESITGYGRVGPMTRNALNQFSQ